MRDSVLTVWLTSLASGAARCQFAGAVGEVADDDLGHVREAFLARRRSGEVAREDLRQGVVVGQEEVRETRDRDVELQRVDAAAEQPLPLPAAQDLAQGRDQRRVRRADVPRALQMARAVQ